MRARIDISEIEAETKIRAKYLRALENEEWDLLPGPTYVKSFLRTYAEALDLDAKLMVEEYKVRHERLSDVELQPISPRPGRERRRSGPVIPRWTVVAVIFVALLVALAALGSDDGGERPEQQGDTIRPPATETDAGPSGDAAAQDDDPARDRPRRPEPVRLQIAATGPVYVCLMGGDRTLVDGATLQAGDRTEVFRSRRFRLLLGNNNVTLRINGRGRSVPASDEAIGLQITPRRGRQPLPADELPDCA